MFFRTKLFIEVRKKYENLFLENLRKTPEKLNLGTFRKRKGVFYKQFFFTITKSNISSTRVRRKQCGVPILQIQGDSKRRSTSKHESICPNIRTDTKWEDLIIS